MYTGLGPCIIFHSHFLLNLLLLLSLSLLIIINNLIIIIITSIISESADIEEETCVDISLASQTLFYCVGAEKESLVQSNTTIGNFCNEIVT